MLQEHDLIPFAPTSLPPGPWLIFAPHPDDEVFGMGGSIALASDQGIRVEVVVMTGGEGAGDPDIRREESRKAGRILGISRHYFMSFPDGRIADCDLYLTDFEPILTRLNPKTVFLPGLQEFHPDHRSTTKMMKLVLERLGYENTVWLYEITRQNEANRLVDITPVADNKIQAIQCHTSQLEQIDYQHIVIGLNQARSFTLGKDIFYAEGYFSIQNISNIYVSINEAIQRYL